MPLPPDSGAPDADDPRQLDPEEVLGRDPRVLLDPTYLGALHARLGEVLAQEDAALVLLHIGLLHGLQDARRARAQENAATPGPACFPALAMRFRLEQGAAGVRVNGAWPESGEAGARLSADAGHASGSCALSAGYTSGWLSGMFDVDLLATETGCAAGGAAQCGFEAREVHAWQADRPALADLARSLPFEAYRSLVRAREAQRALERRATAAPAAGIDRSSACVHIWGPVMVLPFGGAEEGLRTLDLLGRDPEAQEVSVVVVDLGDAILDPAFGALALDLIVRTASGWGAETLFAAGSPLSEPVLQDLEHPPLLVFKDLERAIAAAFQIAAVQRRPA